MSHRFPSAFGRLAIAALSLVVVSIGCVSVTPPPSPGTTGIPTSAPPTAGLPTPGPVSTPTVPGATPTAESSTPSPTTSQTPGGSTAPQTPGATVDPALAAQIDGVTAQVPPIRELEATKEVPYDFINRDQFRDELIATADEDTPVEVRAAEERLLKRMGMLPADADLTALLIDLYSAEVAAYYRPETGTFYIIARDKPFGPADKIAVAHEYTHALQDQHFDLEGNRVKDLSEGDAALAQLAVIEGDATLTSQEWMIGNLSTAEQLQLLNEALEQLTNDQLASMPLVLRRQLEFPYTEGFLFTRDVYGLGGFDAVNQAIQAPPASTEQILHSQKYYDQEAAVAVPLDDMSASLGAGWSRSYEQTFGELAIQILATGGEQPDVSIPGLPVDWPHQEVAAGWGGDRLNMYENTDGRWAIVWVTAWDSESDQAEFQARMSELGATFSGPTSTQKTQLQTEHMLVTVVASDEATMSAGLNLFSDIQ